MISDGEKSDSEQEDQNAYEEELLEQVEGMVGHQVHLSGQMSVQNNQDLGGFLVKIIN